MAKTLKPQFTLEELEIIKLTFNKNDKNKDRVLDKDEFKTAVASSKLGANEVNQLFALFDSNGDGKVSFAEFITGLSVMTQDTPKRKLEFLFNFYDTNGDGTLSKEEIIVLINHIKKVVSSLLGPELEQQAGLEAEAIVKRLDANSDGNITRDEWVSYGSKNAGFLEIFGLN